MSTIKKGPSHRRPKKKNRDPNSTENKSIAQFSHARTRAFERYGVVLTKELHSTLVQKIKTGNAILLEQQSLRVFVYRLFHEDKRFLVIYDRKRSTIVTFLPDMDVYVPLPHVDPGDEDYL